MPGAALQRAAALFNAGRLDEARAAGLDLLASNPQDFYALHLLGAIAVRTGRFEEAIEYENRALSIRRDDPEALCNRAIALRTLGRVDEAIADYDRVIAAHPAFAPAHSLKGVALAALNRHREAIGAYSKAEHLDPNLAAAKFNRALSELVLGDFESGWRDFEWRWGGSDTQIPKRTFAKPQWLGEEPRGKTLLLHAEQGLGDAIQFSRYVPLLVERGASVIVEVQKPLVDLLSALPARVIAMGDSVPPFDYHAPVMSLPLAFGTRLETIPANVPYLRAPAGHVERWAKRLGHANRPRAGLAWSGSPTLRNDRNRTIPLAKLSPLRDPQWQFASLQKELRDTDRVALEAGAPIEWLGDELADFRDTAAVIELMDLVVTVDTAVAHLAGAMGKPTWLLLPFSPDWRWMLERKDSPWYPTMRLFRQARPGDWDGVLNIVRDQLSEARLAHTIGP